MNRGKFKGECSRAIYTMVTNIYIYGLIMAPFAMFLLLHAILRLIAMISPRGILGMFATASLKFYAHSFSITSQVTSTS